MSDKFAAVPQPVGSLDSLYEVVLALKQNIELLTGQSGTDDTTAVTAAALPGLVKVVTDNTYVITAIQQVAELSAYLQEQINTATTQLQNNIDAVQEESQSAYNDLNDALNTEIENRTTADQVINVSISSLQSSVNNNTAAITTEAATRATADSALSGRIDSVTASANNNAAAISSEAVTRANADSALSATLSTVSAVAGRQRVFSQSSAPTAQAVGDLWIDTSNGNLIKYWDGTNWVARDDTRIATNVAAISSETIARANADSALTAQINSLTSTVSGNSAAITSEASTRATADTALGGRIDSLTATVSNNTAAINNEAVVRAAADGSLSSQINSVSAQSSAGTANGKYQLTAVSANDGAAAEFAVKVSSDGASYSEAGMRLQTFSNGTSRVVFDTSQFIVRSGTSGTKVPFAISGSDLIGNFLMSSSNVYGLGAFATANKITSGNVATYIDTAAIKDAYIESVSANKVSVSQLSAFTANLGTVTAGRAQSPDAKFVIDFTGGSLTVSD